MDSDFYSFGDIRYKFDRTYYIVNSVRNRYFIVSSFEKQNVEDGGKYIKLLGIRPNSSIRFNTEL